MANGYEALNLRGEDVIPQPVMTGTDAMFNWLTGSWNQKVNNYQADVNAYNASKALKRAEWEREDSSYQRLVADLQKAGINPYWALAGGGSASPVGTSGSSAIQYKKSKEPKDISNVSASVKNLAITALAILKIASL